MREVVHESTYFNKERCKVGHDFKFLPCKSVIPNDEGGGISCT
ncbi:hypothetical protein P8625_05460 [Tenacibaculum tangerinum]|uniref:Uncharacterized protein n=1 Tax=Tenacibaculum tangerinum TaxID=3038772 RepID=A0ABY8L7J2_9FLAO|nr:hypothetical protein [Tenacibaculum tangerinum]WGH76607.1 hypothetical protein P8625_05460 [Tenacibaculum tangerinum]